MTDTAELLANAAGKIRINAQDATPGTRDIEPDADAWRVTTLDGRPVASTGSLGDALHTAQWSREAALAVADWLEAAGRRIAQPEERRDALVVARAILDPEPIDAPHA